MAHPSLRFVSRLSFLILVSLLLLCCPNPFGPGSSATATGGIDGHARYAGQSDNSGIVISAENVDNSGKTLAVKQAVSKDGSMGARAVAAQATTDSTGAYKLTGLAAGTYTVYASSQSSLEKAVTTGVTVSAGRDVTAADICLTPTGQISGKATLNGAASGNLGIVVFIAGTSYSAMTDDTGAYTISSVPASTGYVLVACTSKQGYDSVIANVDVTAGSTTTAAPLNLPLHVAVATTGSVSGTAQLSGGVTGNSGIFVYLSGTSYLTMTNDAGGFNLTGVAPGSYTLVASKEWYSSATVSAVAVTTGNTTDVGTINLATFSQAIVSTLAGTAGLHGNADGVRFGARFYWPDGITTDGTSLYVVDNNNDKIRTVVISTGAVTTLAGSSVGSADGPGSTAQFKNPACITTDGPNLYMTDQGNSTIRAIVSSSGAVTTLAGNPTATGSANGMGNAARFNSPTGITTDGTNLYVVDTGNDTIRSIVISTGAVTTLAGSPTVTGSIDGTGNAARFFLPIGITTDGTNLYVADMGNNTIRKIVISTGAVTTLAGGSASTPGSADGTGRAARFYSPWGITTDGTYLFVTDDRNYTIRKIVIATGAVTTLVGSAGTPGSADGTGSAARFNFPTGITTDGINLFVADNGNNTIREIKRQPSGPPWP